MPTTHHLFWWNLENLFDEENSTSRTEKLQRVIKGELSGWTPQVLDKKLDQLVSVMRRFNSDKGPDIMGVCEVENKAVLDKLVLKLNAATSRVYHVLHHDSRDERGIDVAFFFDSTKYTRQGELYSLEVMRRNATRDIVQVQLKTAAGNTLVLLGNHWPSRSGGQYESEPYRMMVGEVLGYFVQRIHEVNPSGAHIVAMGDFNDQPFDRSLTQYANSTHVLKQVENARSIDYLYNLMASKIDGKTGTYVFGSEVSILDQFLISKDIAVNTSRSKFSVQSPASILIFPGMVKGEYNTPVKFGRPSEPSTHNLNGYSDHLPIGLQLTEK
ncbi:MAG TPA: endonuclease/exonuclease/phosphatase family protein [Phnomibacter sp.]|nr:endonuclease/exonuclease/phosphatase family protein [Phnomibacter sp.]